MYEIHRRLLDQAESHTGTQTSSHTGNQSVNQAGGPLEFLGLTGTRRFEDATIPAGTTGAVYRITAVRSTRRGEPAEFIVNLGVAESGAGTAEPATPAADDFRLAG